MAASSSDQNKYLDSKSKQNLNMFYIIYNTLKNLIVPELFHLYIIKLLPEKSTKIYHMAVSPSALMYGYDKNL